MEKLFLNTNNLRRSPIVIFICNKTWDRSRIKNFERHYGVHLTSLRRSRRFTLSLCFVSFLLLYTLYRLSSKASKISLYSAELENCAQSKLERYQTGIDAFNVLVYELPFPTSGLSEAEQEMAIAKQKKLAALKRSGSSIIKAPAQQLPEDEISLLNEAQQPVEDNKFHLPYTGNGYIGLSLLRSSSSSSAFQEAAANGIIFAPQHQQQHHTLGLPLMYSGLVRVFTDEMLDKKEVFFTEILKGSASKLTCYQSSANKGECVSVLSTIYAHRTRPSILVEELTFNNPTKESVTFDVVQSGASSNWNQSKTKSESFNGMDFSITRGIIDIAPDSTTNNNNNNNNNVNSNKPKHLCIVIGSTRLPSNIRLKEHDFNSRYSVITVVKYTPTLLSGRVESLESVLIDLEQQVLAELKQASSIGFVGLKREHTQAWSALWRSGFGISNSLASGALNPDAINASIYYVLCNSRAPHLEQLYQQNNQHRNATSAVLVNEFNMESCYGGQFSTLHATTLWKMPQTEAEAAALASLWSLTLLKHGCRRVIELGAMGFLQAIVLSLGALKFTHHHLDLNLNPRQLHRNYYFRQVNYANLGLISIDIEVSDLDNHARLYVTLDQDETTATSSTTAATKETDHFYACDGGCIDPALELRPNERLELPVKLTEPLTAILYISNDRRHLDQLKHTLHVQEVDVAPAQDVNTLALHKHGHHLAGLATLFWALFVILIIVFHLFLFKLIYREMIASTMQSSSSESSVNKKREDAGFGFARSKYQRFARTV